MSNRKDLMKEHVNTRGFNMILIAIFALSIVNSSIAINGVLGNIADLFAR